MRYFHFRLPLAAQKQILKALIFIQKAVYSFTLSVTFGFHGASLLTLKTDRLNLRGLYPGKSDVTDSKA